jgi:leucyl aminopeptidase
VKSLNSQLNVVNLQSTIASLSAYHTRYFESNTGQEAAEWIHGQLQDVIDSNYATGMAEVQFFNHTWRQPSVIARIFGDSSSPHAEEIVIVGAHLDSTIVRPPSLSCPSASMWSFMIVFGGFWLALGN